MSHNRTRHNRTSFRSTQEISSFSASKLKITGKKIILIQRECVVAHGEDTEDTGLNFVKINQVSLN